MSLIRAVSDEFLRLAQESGKTLTKMQLQKLAYYTQAWSLAVRDCEAIDDDFQAWKYGPVNPSLWAYTRRFPQVEVPPSDGEYLWMLFPEAKRLILAVWQSYGDKGGYALSDLTHHEQPWIAARGDTPADMNSTEIVETSLMKSFYATHIKPTPIEQYAEELKQKEAEASAKLASIRKANGGRLVVRRAEVAAQFKFSQS